MFEFEEIVERAGIPLSHVCYKGKTMTQDTSVVICHAGTGTHVLSAGNLYRLIAEGQQTNDRFSLMEVILEPGQGAPYHIHTREDEAFFVLDGEVTFYMEDHETVGLKESFVSCPPGSVRGFRNNTNKQARMLIFYSSAGVEEMTLKDGEIVEPGFKISDMDAGRDIQCPQLAEEYGIQELKKPLPEYIV